MTKIERRVAVMMFLVVITTGTTIFILSLNMGHKGALPPTDTDPQYAVLRSLLQVIGTYHAEHGSYPSKIEDLSGTILILEDGSSRLFDPAVDIGGIKQITAYTITPRYLDMQERFPISKIVVAYVTAREDDSCVKVIYANNEIRTKARAALEAEILGLDRLLSPQTSKSR